MMFQRCSRLLVSFMITGRVDEIWIAAGPEKSRVMFLTAGTVVEIWHEFTVAPNCIGEVHQLKIDQVFAGQNRATARLEDGTPVSLRTKPRDKVQAGQRRTATIIAAPRQSKPLQAVLGARLVGTHLVLLPGDAGLYASRALPDDQVKPLRDSMAEKLPPGFGAILRRAAAGQEVSLVEGELEMLIHLWQDRVKLTSCIHDGGTLYQKVGLHAPGPLTCRRRHFIGRALHGLIRPCTHERAYEALQGLM